MPTLPLPAAAPLEANVPAPPSGPAQQRSLWRRVCARPLAAVRRAARGDDGDVPGWVLVTLMTAGLVLALWAVAGPALTNLFTTAIARVTSFGG